MLLEEAAAGDNHQHQQVIFEPELIVRQSTKATPAPRRAAPAGRLPAGDGGQPRHIAYSRASPQAAAAALDQSGHPSASRPG
jgi:hypothetical protein